MVSYLDNSPKCVDIELKIKLWLVFRIHPIMETQKVVDWDTIWTQLYKRVQSHFNSLKEAFLQMDKVVEHYEICLLIPL